MNKVFIGGIGAVDRFYIRFNFGHWSVIDRNDNKMVVGYSKKEDAENTANGLNKIKTDSKITKMKEKLKTLKGYSHFLK